MLIGKQFGRYEIRSKIGAGGMGEVYLAHDAELDRAVAVKILTSEFSGDADRKSRFKQEARAASALNHPNIITIYEIGENENGSFLATELIEGETLRDIIKNRKPSIAEILRIIEQVAKALTAAHRAHIVHRDIKPENIMLRSDGIVKVLDFGLAKPTLQKPENDADSVNTIPGMVMGSARYMSPEQARGLPVDERTDIWSLGVILYEMLTGNAPFNGATTSDTIAAVIYKEPAPLGSFIENAPPELTRIIRKALQKDRDERYQNVKDFALDVKDLLSEIEHQNSSERKFVIAENADISENATIIHQTNSAGHQARIHQTDSANHPTKANVVSTADLKLSGGAAKKSGWKVWKIAVASLAAIFIIGLAANFYYLKIRTSSVEFKAFEKSQVSRLSSDGKVNLPTISPNGKYIAYVSGETGNLSLVVRQISTDSVITVIPPTNLEFRSITFSPADDYIYYTQNRADFSVNTLYQVPTLGGTPKKLIEDVDSGVTFSPDGKQFAFMRHTTKPTEDLIFIGDIDGSNLRQLIGSRQAGFDFFLPHPAWSPDGATILIGAGKKLSGFINDTKIAAISVADQTVKTIPARDFYVADSFCWFKDGSEFLFIAQETRNAPTQIWRYDYANGAAAAITNDFNNYRELGVSADGKTIVSIKGETVSSLWRYAPQTKENVQISPDSRNLEGSYGLAQMSDGRLIYSRNEGTKVNFQIADADGKNPRPLATDLGIIYSPVPSPDGKYIVFSSQISKSPRIWRIDADGKNPVQLTEENPNSGDFNPEFTADGKTVVFQRQSNNEERAELAKISIEGGQSSIFYSNPQQSVNAPHISPDGKRIAFSEYDVNTFDKKIIIASLNNDVFGSIEKTLEFNLINSISWSPDSKSLTVSSSKEGAANLFRLPLDGSPQQPLTNYNSGRILNYVWSKDGKSLLVVRGITTNDLILITDNAAAPAK